MSGYAYAYALVRTSLKSAVLFALQYIQIPSRLCGKRSERRVGKEDASGWRITWRARESQMDWPPIKL